jgi:DNA-binding NarL/FixJ family response regulator
MKILIADDHPIYRRGLVEIIRSERDVEWVEEAGSGNDALQIILRRKPDIAILDISMPGMTGLDVVRSVKSHGAASRFVILTMYREEEYFQEAMNNGVQGYLLKESADEDIIGCLRAVLDDEYYVSPSISSYLVRRALPEPGMFDTLTPTELKILRLISENKTSKEIAAMLFVSYRTIQNHRTNICTKLNLEGHNRLLQFALEHKSLLFRR